MRLTRSLKARRATAVLFQKWNDVDVYVEDTALGSEKLYATLLDRIVEGRFRIARVIALGGRERVLSECADDQADGGRPRIYLIDGDLDLLLGNPAPELRRLYRHPVYCMENHLVEEQGMVEVLHGLDPDKSKHEIASLLNFSHWIDSVAQDLLLLFILFSLCKKYIPERSTVSQRVCRFVSQSRLYRTDARVVQTEIRACRDDLYASENLAKIHHEELQIFARVNRSRAPQDFISGKDFLLPLARQLMLSVTKFKLTKSQLKQLLAGSCSVSGLEDLRIALESASMGE